MVIRYFRCKSRLDSLYKEPSFWELERERKKDERIHYINDDGIEVFELLHDPNDTTWDNSIYLGQYRALFDDWHNITEREPNVDDYHWLHYEIIRALYYDIIIFHLSLDEDPDFDYPDETTYNYRDILYSFEKEVLKVEIVFYEVIAKIKNIPLPHSAQQLKDILKSSRGIFSKSSSDEFNKNYSEKTLDELQIHLIKKKVIYADGTRVIKSLHIVAKEVYIFTRQSVTSQFLLENFRKKNGDKFKADYCDNVRDWVNNNVVLPDIEKQ